jgi:AcrR family transcriptional regulator
LAVRDPFKDVAAPAPAQETDGRRLRGLDSRRRIVEAMLELVRETEYSPSAEQVAARAGVGLRTVFRQFNDMESLYAEMSQVIEAGLWAVASRPFVARTWRGRLTEMVERRSAAFEQLGPIKRAADAMRSSSPFLAERQARLVTVMRMLLGRILPPEIASDPERFEALDLLLSFEAWWRLRRDQGLDPDRARVVLNHAVSRVASSPRRPAGGAASKKA